MKITNLNKLKPKQLVVFDLDGTLAPSKTPMDKEMVRLVEQLLTHKKVAVIGGGKYDLFKEQLLAPLTVVDKNLYKNLFLFPTTSTSFFRYQGDPRRSGRGRWKNVYRHELGKAEREKIKRTFAKVLKEINYQAPPKTYGKVIEDRGTQITWSALGQDVVKALGSKKGVALKDKWRDENTPVKLKIAKLMNKYLSEFAIRAAGHTSVDVTKKGIDKAYGLKQIEKHLGIKIKDMLFVGDAIFPGGNDYAITKTKVDYVAVKDPEETKEVIKEVLK